MNHNEEKQALVDSLDIFIQGYLECALWTADNDVRDQGETFADFSTESLQKCKSQCEKFQEDYGVDLDVYEENHAIDHAGHDLWLSRNGHGAGFWDREGVPKETRDRLHEAARGLGEQYVVLGDDGELHLEGGF